MLPPLPLLSLVVENCHYLLTSGPFLAHKFSRLRFSQLEGDTVDGGCGLFFEVYFPGGHLDEYLGFRYGTYDEPCPLRCIIIFWQY